MTGWKGWKNMLQFKAIILISVQTLGASILDSRPGYSQILNRVRREMRNFNFVFGLGDLTNLGGDAV
jgi:hypothetical protein